MAYAVLASLYTTTDQMLNPDPYSIPCKRETIESLHNNVAILLSFLENTPPHIYQTIKSLETKIRDVAYEAEDILESHIAKHFRSISGSDETDINMLSEETLEEVMKGFESLLEDVKEIQGTGNLDGLLEQQMTSSLSAAGSLSTGKSKFVLLDEDFMTRIKEQLASEESRLKVLPIVGMGGIGKTTLAKALLDDPFCVGHFDVRAWVTISQQYRIQDVVQNLLKDIKVRNTKTDIGEDLHADVGLHKILFNRRYLIVLDDVWETKAWDELQKLFPNCNNGSRIMVTTRQSEVATYAAKSHHGMKLLNDEMSWVLLRQELFPQQGNNCPSELVEIGKEIAKKCRGLPLAISVIGGLLYKEKMTRELWKHVADNIKSVLTEEDDQCLEILSLSYNYLPHHLKPCILYMGIYEEDYNIPVTQLLQFWVAEGFLKPTSSRNMEEVAAENLKDLIERNLILIEKVNYKGKPKSCKIHDLIRDLCIREARKEKFLYVCDKNMDFNPEEANGNRRLSILHDYIKGDLNMMQSMPGNRSFICFGHLPSYIWSMPQLRHLEVPSSSLPPLPGRTEMSVCVLKSLETLFVIEDFRCNDEVLVRIPNLRKLKIRYEDDDWSYYPFVGSTWESIEDNFKKLEYLMINSAVDLNEWIVEDDNHFPSLRHLFLRGCEHLEEIPSCIGEITTLEIIELDTCSDGVVSSAKNIQDDYEIKLVINNTTRHAYDE
ncbi:hypothetical protein ACJIZ3_011121 [Penstemon smallii]|uniref:NB-ARC domain-containing protein n=1 Tax=Penstemon smallii TaxID=265156 RepID=A0ABD3UI87_9LAMI